MTSPIALDFYDAELRAHHQHLRAAYEIRAGDEVLDIGCGTGLTTREAARAAAPGRVVGATSRSECSSAPLSSPRPSGSTT